MKIKISDLYSGFKEKKFYIPVKSLSDRGIIFNNQTISCRLTTNEINDGIEISGLINALPKYQCVRCLEENPLKLSIPFKLMLYNRKSYINQNHRQDVIYFSEKQNHLKLNNILADLIALAKPINPLCNPNCKGLCHICGINKKLSCHCKIEEVNTNWNVLKNLNTEKN